MNEESAEIEQLFSSLLETYGYDFRHYAYESARRRVLQRVQHEDLSSISQLQQLILKDENIADTLLRDLSINVTEMFRDPPFYRELRQQILPHLKQQEHIKIWHAGCATGEEVYSMAIMLTEMGLYSKSQLFATDFNNSVLDKAKHGAFPIQKMRSYVQNYQKSGGDQPFSDYYHANYSAAIMAESLKKNILFSHHNLTIDQPFGDMNMIVCRNVIIYFNRKLQEHVLQLFYDSLGNGGFLCLGSHENLILSHLKNEFEIVSSEYKIYRKLSHSKHG